MTGADVMVVWLSKAQYESCGERKFRKVYVIRFWENKSSTGLTYIEKPSALLQLMVCMVCMVCTF